MAPVLLWLVLSSGSSASATVEIQKQKTDGTSMSKKQSTESGKEEKGRVLKGKRGAVE